jgi:predicted ATPase
MVLKMKFNLRNVGIIKKAEINFDGLTVIAGENDTGKTTLGKYLYEAILNKSLGISLDSGSLKTHSENDQYRLEYSDNEDQIKQVIFIDSPNFLDMFSYIKNAALLFLQRKLSFNNIDDHRTDLVLLLSQVKDENHRYKDLYHQIEQIIDGQMYYDKEQDEIFYKKNQIKLKDKLFQMKDTASGIKMFGYLQILCLNKSIEKNTLLILDEPEVHLHPKWQLKYAEILTKLVKTGVKVLVNSHSPYMIEALELFSQQEGISSNFYLTKSGKNGTEMVIINNNLEAIYQTLSEPFSQLEEISLREGCLEW